MLTLVQLSEPTAKVLLLNAAVHPLHWLSAIGVWDQLPKSAAILLTTGMGIQRGAGCALGDQVFQIAGFDSHGVRQLESIRLATEAV